MLKISLPIFKGKTNDATQNVVNRQLYKVVDKDSTKSFHTFRAKFIENTINLHPEKIAIIQEIVGHRKNENDKLTIDTYAKGFKLELKVDIVNTVKYD